MRPNLYSQPPRAGRRRTFLALALVCLALLPARAWSSLQNPLIATGDLTFTVDMPVFYDDASPRIDVAAVLYHPQIKFQPKDENTWEATLRMEVKLARSGLVPVRQSQVYTIQVSAEEAAHDPSQFALLELSAPVPAGRWAATVTVEDTQGGRGFGTRQGQATGIVNVAAAEAAAPTLSDPEFRWAVKEIDQDLPNPERLFGVNQDVLVLYFELTGTRPGQAYPVQLEIEDPAFDFSQIDSLVLQGDKDRLATVYRLPMGTFLEGIYRLHLQPQWEGSPPRTADFQVSWNMARIVQTGRDVDTELQLVFTGEQLDTLRRMPRTSQIQYLESFWSRLDPTPGTEENETYNAFLGRVDYAKRHLASQNRPGPLTDRGRTYIRYGPPAEVTMEVVPLNRDSLEEAVLRVHDPAQYEISGHFGKTWFERPVPNVEAAQAFGTATAVGSTEDAAFEMWSYHQDGDRLFDDGPVWPTDVDLRLLFVDKLGTGEYLLETTNHPFHRR